MLLAVQIPLADARTFESSPTHRLPRPRFDLGFDPDGAEFLRSFGPVCERAPGLPADWPSEDLYCHADRGLKLDVAELRRLKRSVRGSGHFTPIARRILSDGKATARAELWLSDAPQGDRSAPLAADDVHRLLEGFSAMKVRCRNPHRTVDTTTASMGPVVAAQLLASSTRRSGVPHDFVPKPWWITSGRPVFLLQYAPHEITELPATAIELATPASGVRLHHVRIGDRLVWLVGTLPGTERLLQRELRLHLLKLHCAREVTRRMLLHLADERLRHADMKWYLEKALGLMSRKRFHRFDPSPTLKLAYKYEEQVSGAQRRSLEEKLREASQVVKDGTTAISGARFEFPF